MSIRKIKYFFVVSVLVGVLQLAALIIFAENNTSAADVNKSGPLQDENTIVTAVFACNVGVYDGINQTTWVKNILSLQDSMIIYTSPDLVGMIRFLRSHASQKTVVVSMNLSDVVKLTTYISTDNTAVDARQLQLFRMQLSRTFFVQKAIVTNPFNSQNFMWSDSDCFRDICDASFGASGRGHGRVAWQQVHVARALPNPRVQDVSSEDVTGPKAL